MTKQVKRSETSDDTPGEKSPSTNGALAEDEKKRQRAASKIRRASFHGIN